MLTTGLTVGLVWGTWHFPLFWKESTFSATLPFTILLARLFSWLPPFRVWMVWIHDQTRSLPVAILMHATLVATQLLLSPAGLTGARLLTRIAALAAMMWLFVALVDLVNRERLSMTSSLDEPRLERTGFT